MSKDAAWTAVVLAAERERDEARAEAAADAHHAREMESRAIEVLAECVTLRAALERRCYQPVSKDVGPDCVCCEDKQGVLVFDDAGKRGLEAVRALAKSVRGLETCIHRDAPDAGCRWCAIRSALTALREAFGVGP